MFQVGIYAVLQCGFEIKQRAYKKRHIYISKSFKCCLKRPKLITDCPTDLTTLADHHKVTPTWDPDHKGIGGNEREDELTRKGSANKFLRPQPNNHHHANL